MLGSLGVCPVSYTFTVSTLGTIRVWGSSYPEAIAAALDRMTRVWEAVMFEPLPRDVVWEVHRTLQEEPDAGDYA